MQKRIADLKAAWLGEWQAKRTNNEAPINPYRVLNELNQTVDIDNTSSPMTPAAPATNSPRSGRPRRPCPTSAGAKPRSWATAWVSAMGAKVAEPEKTCINVWGDAAIGFTGMDFETAVRERIPILSILMNKSPWRSKFRSCRVAQEKYGSTDISGNYADMAKAFGGYGERITDPGDIRAAIERGIAATKDGQPALLEFITDKEITISNE